MFALILAALLFDVRSSNANAVESPEKYSNIEAEAGLCVVIPCDLTAVPDSTLESAVWYKCKENCTDSDIILGSNNTNPTAQSGLRVSLLEPDLGGKNCSLIISDITQSDSGSHQFRYRKTMATTSQRASVIVKDLIQKPIMMIPPLTEGQQTTLTCTAPGLCSGSVPKITWTWRRRGERYSHIIGNVTAFKTENLTAVTQRHSSTLTFDTSVIHHGTNLTCKVSLAGDIIIEETSTLSVISPQSPKDVRKLEISGKTTVKQGDTLNLTCRVDNIHPYVITWTKLNMNKNLAAETGSDLRNDTGIATLVIPNVTVEYSGEYVCTAKHQSRTLMEGVNITVTLPPRILNRSGCINKSGVLACVCISQGFPLPTIKWPLLENHSEYSVITTLSTHTVNSTITLAAGDQSNTAVECVSTNENREVTGNLIINRVEEEAQYMKWLRIVTQLEIIIAFLIGLLLSAIICCWARNCCRRKQRTYGSGAETLEMVTRRKDPLMTNHEEPLVVAVQAQEADHAIDQEVAEAGGAMAAETSDVNYSNLDFSLMKSPAEAKITERMPEAEYAEIRKEKAEETQDREGREGEEMIGQEEGEDMALYSTVKEVMDEI